MRIFLRNLEGKPLLKISYKKAKVLQVKENVTGNIIQKKKLNSSSRDKERNKKMR
jgi:hypothetical protein